MSWASRFCSSSHCILFVRLQALVTFFIDRRNFRKVKRKGCWRAKTSVQQSFIDSNRCAVQCHWGRKLKERDRDRDTETQSLRLRPLDRDRGIQCNWTARAKRSLHLFNSYQRNQRHWQRVVQCHQASITDSRRSPFYGTSAVVACSQQLATEIGLR